MVYMRVALAALSMLLVSVSWAEPKLVKYTYTGPAFTKITGAQPPWTDESRMTGYFLHEELPPNTTTDFLDPDIDFPFPNIPEKFAFTDGARTITEANMEPSMKNTRDRKRPLQHECRVFWVTTDDKGDIVAWDILFVSHVLENTYLTVFNGYEHGQDETQVQDGDFGCTFGDDEAREKKCTGNVNYTSEGPKFRGTVFPGSWEKEYVEASALTAQAAE
jgi:hypothetical protein